MKRLGLARTSLAMAAWLSAPLAHAEIMDIVWDAAGRYERVLSIAPGKFAEVCGKLAKGHPIGWTFDADQPTNFNIHYHLGKQVVYPARQDAVRRSSGQLSADLDEDHCWMWSNKGSLPIRMSVTLTRQ